MRQPTSILIIAGAPDDRQSTAMLRRLANAASNRPDVRVDVWFLRCAWYQRLWPNSRLVDALRTWLPARIAASVGLESLAGPLRGLRLRWWLWRARPDLVVLNDGLGERLLEHAGSPVVVHRRNRQPTDEAQLEPPPARSPHAVLAPPEVASGLGTHPPVLVEYETRDDWAESRRIGRDDVRAERRRQLGLPGDAPLITGWGTEGWIDGAELFVRELWVLEHRHGIRAHGAWFGSDEDRHEVDRLATEARRCGVGDRFHHLVSDRTEDRLCGDVVFLPYRDVVDPEELLVAMCSGQAVVTFPVTTLTDESIRVVDHLDLDAAGEQLAQLLAGDRSERWAGTLRRFDVQSLVDELARLVQGAPPR